ncbi:PTS mannose/fructose/sorbose transporter subunit IIB [Lachnospiraceae bacterium oral taxon 500]|nr:PTS mannose/fructose/sorbose transporter subunit IIB [Lachnospiraceae bacterium oral taxon 500]
MSSQKKNIITAIRMDDRLLHGIIMTQWLSRISCDRVMVIDDAVAKDPLKTEVMRLSKPVNKALSILDSNTALTNFKNGKYREQKVFILIRDFNILSGLTALGYELPKINIGMHFCKEGEYALTKRIMLSRREVAVIHTLLRAGCDFETQYVPSDTVIELNPQLKAL